MNLKFTKLAPHALMLVFLLHILISPTTIAQPLGGPGRSIVPGTHFILTAENGGFVPAAGATWINSSGWQLIANEDAVRTPTFNLQHLQSGNLKWYARVNTPLFGLNNLPLSTYVTFVEWYGATPSTETPNTYITTGGGADTFSGDLNLSVNYDAFSLDISKSWFPLDPAEPDNIEMFVTEFWMEVDDSVLPISIVSFTGKQIEENVNLTWKTANESNFSHFEVLKSNDAKEFGSIGKVNSSSQNFYNFSDNQPNEGANYYQLRMVDLDGSSKLSKVISVNFEKGSSFISVENPAVNGEFKVFTNLKNPKFTLLNSLGTKINIETALISNNAFSIKSNNKISGVYFLNIISDGKLVTKKVLMP